VVAVGSAVQLLDPDLLEELVLLWVAGFDFSTISTSFSSIIPRKSWGTLWAEPEAPPLSLTVGFFISVMFFHTSG